MTKSRVNPSRVWEQIAVDLIARTISDRGVVVDQTASGLPDFRIEYFDGRTAIGEVGWATDEAKVKQWSYILEQEEPQRIALPPGSGSWIVELNKHARTKHLSRTLPPLIAGIFAQNIHRYSLDYDWPPTQFGDDARRLGITSLSRLESGRQDSAYYQPEGMGGFIPDDPDVVVAWVGEFLQKPEKLDLTEKLADQEADECHIFLVVGEGASFGIQTLVQRSGIALPDAVPDVPNHITHLWLWPEMTFENRRVGSLWIRERGWASFS